MELCLLQCPLRYPREKYWMTDTVDSLCPCLHVLIFWRKWNPQTVTLAPLCQIKGIKTIPETLQRDFKEISLEKVGALLWALKVKFWSMLISKPKPWVIFERTAWCDTTRCRRTLPWLCLNFQSSHRTNRHFLWIRYGPFKAKEPTRDFWLLSHSATQGAEDLGSGRKKMRYGMSLCQLA